MKKGILDTEVDIEELLDKLDFANENVDNEAMAQPTWFKKAIVNRFQTMQERNRSESKLDGLRSKLYLIIKRKDEEKKTESYIKEIINRNKKYRAAVEEFNRATEYEELAKRVIDAYEMKMQAMRVVSQMLGAEAGVNRRMEKRAEELNSTRKKLKDRYRD